MSLRCRCHTDFPARNFQKVRDADEFCTRMRFSTVFLPLDSESTRFGCRHCGQVWHFILSSAPPYVWRPHESSADPAVDIVVHDRRRFR